jgi:hypothetical protein
MFIRKLLIQETKKGKDIADILSSMGHKDAKFAEQLLFADEEISQLMRAALHVEDNQQEKTQVRSFNKTKRMREETQKQKNLQNQELQEKLKMLKEHRAA